MQPMSILFFLSALITYPFFSSLHYYLLINTGQYNLSLIQTICTFGLGIYVGAWFSRRYMHDFHKKFFSFLTVTFIFGIGLLTFFKTQISNLSSTQLLLFAGILFFLYGMNASLLASFVKKWGFYTFWGLLIGIFWRQDFLIDTFGYPGILLSTAIIFLLMGLILWLFRESIVSEEAPNIDPSTTEWQPLSWFFITVIVQCTLLWTFWSTQRLSAIGLNDTDFTHTIFLLMSILNLGVGAKYGYLLNNGKKNQESIYRNLILSGILLFLVLVNNKSLLSIPQLLEYNNSMRSQHAYILLNLLSAYLVTLPMAPLGQLLINLYNIGFYRFISALFVAFALSIVTYVYFILPYLGLLNSFFYLIYVLLTLGIVVQYKIEGPKAPRFYVILYLFLSVLIINHIYKNIFFLDFTSTNTAMREKSEGFSIEHLEPQMKLDGAMDSVRLLEDKRRNAFYLIGNGDITANWSPLYPTEHQMLATLTPLLAVGHAETPHNALIMGLKEGVMTDILLDIPSISAVTTIENEPAYIQIASQLNYYPQIFLNKASHVNTQDYRAYLHSTTGLFDLIVLNVDRYWKRNTAYFFTKEFYTLIKNHLSNEGVFSQDLDLRTLPTATLNTLLKTIHAVFPYTQLYMVTDNHMIVVSSISPLQNHFDRLFSNPKIDARLAKFAITSPNDLNARYFANEDLLDLYLQTFTQGDKGDNLFFDYFPFLEYESAHNLRSRVASSIPQIRWGVFPPLDYLFHDDVVSVDSIHINALSNVSKNYHTADAIYRYIKTGTQTKKGLPSDIVEALETLEVSDMAYCKDITERHIWLRAYAYLMEHTLPYLSKDKMKTIIDKMKKHPCHALYASAPDTVLEWISLHEALIANRYREMLGHATKIYDKTRNNIGTQIALTYILLAQVKLHQFSDAVKTWAEFPFKQSSSDVSRMLVRYATNQLQNTHNNNP